VLDAQLLDEGGQPIGAEACRATHGAQVPVLRLVPRIEQQHPPGPRACDRSLNFVVKNLGGRIGKCRAPR
jgi:hypothetical protein